MLLVCSSPAAPPAAWTGSPSTPLLRIGRRGEISCKENKPLGGRLGLWQNHTYPFGGCGRLSWPTWQAGGHWRPHTREKPSPIAYREYELGTFLHSIPRELEKKEMDTLLRTTDKLISSTSKRKNRRLYKPEFIMAAKQRLNLEDPLDAVFACLTTCFYTSARLGEAAVRMLELQPRTVLSLPIRVQCT